MNLTPVLSSRDCRTPFQRALRTRLSRHSLAAAVRYAVRVFFRFRYRALRGKALWCDTQHVWLGRETFLNWALGDTQIDIPWLVAGTIDAPEDVADLLAAVRLQLFACWADRARCLPCKEKPHWLPLP